MSAFELSSLRRPLILDGATGTGLQRRGMPSGACSEQWVLEHPEAIIDLQSGYAAAGSRAVYAPTFGANRGALGRHGLADRVREYNLALVELSRRAVGDTAAVGGDISPSGLAMPPVDAETFERLVELFTEQAEALEEAGVDFFTVETQMAPAETRAAVLAVKSVSRRPVIASFTLSPSGRVIYGASLPAAALGLEPLGVEAVGVNCVGDLNLVTRSLRSLRRVTALRLLAKPNAGQPHVTDGETRYDMTPEALAEAAREFLAAGASLLGGCCGTTEAHIAALAALAESAEVETAPAPAEEWAASEYEVVDCASLSPEEIVPVEIDDDLEDSADEAAEDGAKLLHVAIRREEDIDALLESGIRTPLEVETASPALEKRFLRLYTGRPRLV